MGNEQQAHAAQQQQQQQQQQVPLDQPFWGVVSVGDSHRIIQSLDEATPFMGDARCRLVVFNSREDAEAYLAVAANSAQPPPVGPMLQGLSAYASPAGAGGWGEAIATAGSVGGDPAVSPLFAAAPAPAAAAAARDGLGFRGGGGGGGGKDMFRAVSAVLPVPRPSSSQPGPPKARPTPAWIDAMVKKLRPDCELDVIQRRAIDDILHHKRNIFLTGSGGVGKSFVTKLLIDLLKAHYEADFSWRVCVTASTGIAATHVDGATVHSAMGIGIPSCWANFGKIFNMNRINEGRWSRHYEVLFIDEVSMVSGEMLDALDDILRQVRKNEEQAFGGIQLVFVGDLAQLPPIQEKLERYNERDFLPRDKWNFSRCAEFRNMPVVFSSKAGKQETLFSNRGMVVQADAWWNADLKIVELTRVFRQDDADFIERLNRMRKGKTTPDDVQWMNHHFYYYRYQQLERAQRLAPPVASPSSPAVLLSPLSSGSVGGKAKEEEEEEEEQQQFPDRDPLHLYPTNADVDTRNKQKMAELYTEEKFLAAHDYVCHDSEGVFDRQGPVLVENDRAREGVELLRANTTFYNRILATDTLKLKQGAKVILLKNLDLHSDLYLVNGSIGTIVKWATTLEEAHFDSQPGGAAAAMSSADAREARRSEWEYKENHVQKWLKKHFTKVPIVRFLNGRTKAIHPTNFGERVVGVGSTCRIQMPLRIAFAVSIHKSQGMSLDQALVNLERCFSGGQTYVAISRVGPKEGLRFATPLSLGKVKTERTFLQWDSLRTAMEERRAAVLELLPEATARMVEGLGLKSLHAYAQRALESKGEEASDPLLRQRLAALKHALGKLKPARPTEPSMHHGGTVIHWQMLPWLPHHNRKRRFSGSFQSP